MKKEFYKTFCIYVLVIISFILAFNIWFEKELWPDGYSSFVYSIKNLFSSEETDNFFINSDEFKNSEFLVEWMVISYNGKKNIIYNGNDDFLEALTAFNGIKNSLTKAGTASEINNNDFEGIHKSSSFVVSFNMPVDLMRLFEKEDDFLGDLGSINSKKILISLSEENSSIKYLYFKDEKTKKNYRLPIKYKNNDIMKTVDFLSSKPSVSGSYAFELNFDKKKEGVDKILFEPFVPISVDKKSIYPLICENIRYGDDKKFFDNVFKLFNIKKDTGRIDKDVDNTINFLGNHTSLKFFQNDIVLYEVNDNSSGVALGTSDTVKGALQFVNTLYKSTVLDSDGYLALNSTKIIDDSTTEFEFIYNTKTTSLYLKNSPAVIMRVKNGEIVYYKQVFIKINETNETINVGSVINAYDAMYKGNLSTRKKTEKITELMPVNIYEDGKVYQKWYIGFSDGTQEFLTIE